MTRAAPDRPDEIATAIGVAALLPARPYEARYTPERTVIGFAFDSQSGVHAFASDRRRPYRTRPNSLALTPAGCDVYSQSASGGEYLVLTLAKGAAPPARQFSDRFQDSALPAARRLRRLLLGGDPIDHEAAEAAMAELHALAMAESLADGQRRGAERWMTPRRLAEIDALIDATLHAPLSVDALAEALGLSAGFLTRALKASIGATPHDYLIDRRLSRARARLAEGERIVDAALGCGFASQAHLTSAMKRRLGATPGDFARRANPQRRRR